MQLSPHKSNTHRRVSLRLVAGVVLLSLLAAACGGSDDDLAVSAAAVAPIETNDGGILVRPPDVLEGDPAEEPAAELPPLVENARLTPIVPFTYFDGTPGSTTEFKGRPTVLNFWASNCAPCVAEMPEFEEVHLALRDKVDFVGVNTADTSRESADRLVEQTGVTYPLVDDSTSAIFREFRGFAMPTTVFLNPQGQVAYSWTGVLNADALTRLINEHILSE